MSGTGDAGDAGATDAHVKKDATSVVDTGTPYVPLGTKCVATDASAPTAWAPDPDAGAALRPPIMQSSGGPVIANPVFVPMTFDGDDMRDQVEDFIASVGCTSYWHSIVPDYGVGDGITAPPVHMSDVAPTAIDDTSIGAFIRNKILAKTIPDAVPNQTLYVIFYPVATDITLQGQHSCQSFGAYHNEFQMADGRRVPYAVIPRCGDIDTTTGSTSHELVEAVSDPLPMSNPAYQFPELSGLAWALAGGGEIGDLCEFNSDAMFLPSDYPFTVQHSWTSHTAYLAQNPCQPSSDVYFAAAPLLTDQVSFNFGSGAQTTPGIKIAVGNNQTIGVTLIASAAWSSPITVSAHDAAQFFGGKSVLSFSWAATSGNVGDTLQLTVSRSGTNAQFNLEPFTIRASSAGVTHSWWVVVGDP